MKLLRYSERNYIEIDLELIRKGSRFWVMSDGVREASIPNSQMEDEPEELGNGMYRVIIPEWLAMKKEFI